MKRIALSLLALVLATLLLSCGAENEESGIVASGGAEIPNLAPTATITQPDTQQVAPTDTPAQSLPADTTATAQPTAPSAMPNTVANANANLRAGPGTNYDVVGSAQQGQALDMVARNDVGDWYQLASDAWIAAFLVDDAPAGLPVAELDTFKRRVPYSVRRYLAAMLATRRLRLSPETVK